MLLEKWILLGRIAPDGGSLLQLYGSNAGLQLARPASTSVLPYTSNISATDTSWKQVAVGESHTLAIRADSKLFSWGNNTFGQLGIGRSQVVSTSIPQAIGGSASWTSVSARGNTSYAVRSDGRLFSWGDSLRGATGTNKILHFANATIFSRIDTNSGSSVGLNSSNLLFTWGNNASGQLGLGSSIHRSAPTQVGASSWTYVNAGPDNIFAILPDGVLFGSGLNTAGQLGTGNITALNTLTTVFPNTNSGSWVSVKSGRGTTAALQSDRTLWVWGAGAAGQLGLGPSVGTLIHRSAPIQITTIFSESDEAVYAQAIGQPVINRSWIQVGHGEQHGTALTHDGKLFTWGVNTWGQLGNNSIYAHYLPRQLGSNSWTYLAASGDNTFAVRSDNTLWAWGQGSGGQLGQPLSNVNRSGPVQVTPPLANVAFFNVYAGKNFTPVVGALAKRNNATALAVPDFEIYTWGQDNFTGATGQGVAVSSISSATVIASSQSADIAGNNMWSDLSIGGNHATAISQSRSPQATTSQNQVRLGLAAWGLNTDGQLGTGLRTHRSRPVQTTSLIDNQRIFDYFGENPPALSFTTISSGFHAGYGITTDGNLWAWGDLHGVFFGVGNNRFPLFQSPQRLNFDTSYTAVSAGSSHFVTIRSGQTLVNGSNTFGQLGLGNIVIPNGLSPVGSPGQYTEVIAGVNTTFFKTPSGVFFGAGDGFQAPFGNGLISESRSFPVQIGFRFNSNAWISKLAVGVRNMAAIGTNNLLYAWGNQFLPTGSSASAFDPLQITTLATTEDEIAYAAGKGVTLPPDRSWAQLSSGQHTLAISSDGSLWAWGNNGTGQLGINTPSAFNIPVKIGNDSWSQVATGLSHSAAIRLDGGLFVWGQGTSGQLGQGNIINRSSPTQVGTLSYTMVSAGTNSTLGILTDGNIVVFGDSTGTAVLRSSPVQLGATGTLPIRFTNAGNSAIVAIDNNRGLYARGLNTSGQLGQFSITNNPNSTVISSLYDASDISTYAATLGVTNPYGSWAQVSTNFSPSHTLGIRNDGTLWAWGINTAGQLGLGDLINRSSPTQIGVGTWKRVAAGISYSAAIRSDDTLWVWGFNTNGNLGINDRLNRSSPVQVGTSSWTQVAVNTESAAILYTAAIRTDGSLFVWGNNSGGQIGNNTAATIHRSSPVQIGTSSWTQVSLGNHSLAIRADRSLFAWGVGTAGRLGTNTIINRSSPVQIGTSSWTSISAGSHSLAIRLDGTLFAWGLNTTGSLGTFDVISRSSPVQVTGGSSFTQVAANQLGTSLGLRLDGRLLGWGTGTLNQFGDNTSVNRSIQVLIGSGSWSQIVSGASLTLGLDTTGALYLWGNNTGNGPAVGLNFLPAPIIPRPVPMVNFTDSWTMTSVGVDHMIGLRSDGSIWAWGSNAFGQLGDDTLVAKSFPTKIGTSSWTQVAAGSLFSIARRIDGTLWSWGQGTFGQLGIGLTTVTASRSSPVQIGTASNWASIPNQLHASTTIALDQAGVYYGWGGSGFGQVGRVRLEPAYASPVKLMNIYDSFTQVAAGENFILSLRDDGALFRSGGAPDVIINPASTVIPTRVGTSSWTQISATLHSASGLCDGKWFTWGFNSTGVLNTGDFVHRSSPTQVGTLEQWKDIKSGLYSQFYVDYQDRTHGIGIHPTLGGGPLGIVRLDPVTSPVMILSQTDSWKQISSGLNHTLAIRSDNKLFAVGNNSFGKLGTNDLIHRSHMTQVGNGSWTTISAGTNESMGIQPDGSKWLWGSNSQGKLLTGDTISRSNPTQVGGTQSWIFVNAAPGATSTLAAISSEYKLYNWNNNNAGQLGIGTVNSALLPSPSYIKSMDDTFTDLTVTNTAGGNASVFAIRRDGRLFSTGANETGQLGLGDLINRSTLTQVGNLSWSQLTAGLSTVAGLTSNATLFSWGLNNFGQLGTNDIFNRSAPTQIGSDSWTAISAGVDVIAGIASNNKLYAWGNNAVNLVSDIVAGHRSSPVQIGTDNWSQISVGTSNILASDSQSSIWAWGLNTTGGLGLTNGGSQFLTTPNWLIPRPSPTQLGAAYFNNTPEQVDNSSWSSVSAGVSFALGIKTDGTIYAWGGNETGQLGVNDLVHRSNPVQLGSQSWSLTAAGDNHAFAISSDGSMWGWGNNSTSRLGLLDLVHRSSPVQIGTSSWSAVSAGTDHSVGIRSDGTLWGWGGFSGSTNFATYNWLSVTGAAGGGRAVRSDGRYFLWGSGINGLNDTIVRSIPTQVGTSSWSFVSSNGFHAIRSDGTLWAAGTETFSGILGINLLGSRSSPTQVGTLSQWTVVSTGSETAMGIRAGLLFAWGSDVSGNTGLNINSASFGFYRSNPLQVGSATWRNVSVASHTVGVQTDGSLWSWGSNWTSALGTAYALPSLQVHRSSPVQVMTTMYYGKDYSDYLTNIGYTGRRLIAASGSVTPLFLDNLGGLYSSGSGTFGATGLGNIINRSSPTQIGTSSWTQISSFGGSFGDVSGAAIRLGGALFTWGTNLNGALGTNDIVNRSSPIQIGNNSWSSVSAGSNMFAILDTGIAFGSGINANQSLGIGDNIIRSSPVQLSSGYKWKRLTSNRTTDSHGIDEYDAFRMWGLDANANAPIEITSLISEAEENQYANFKNQPILSWTQVEAGRIFGMGILSDGSLWTWGNNGLGNLGNNGDVRPGSLIDSAFLNTKPIKLGQSSWSFVCAGNSSAAAIRSDGLLFVWGFNGFGQLGTDNTSLLSSPTLVGAGLSWLKVSASGNTFGSVAALRSDGALFMWGDNSNGQLGTNDLVARSNPIQIPGSWYDVSVNETNTLAIDATNRRLFAWGSNTSGQLGISNLISRSSPTQIGTANWKYVNAGLGGSSYALRYDSRLFAWGLNTSGQLGDSTIISKSSPVQIGSDLYSQVTGPILSGQFNATAIRIDGRLFTWGLNTSGQLGDSTIINRSAPVQIGNNLWRVAYPGAAIDMTNRLFAWGINSDGQLGQNNNISRSSPVQIGSTSWTNLFSAGSHMFALDQNNLLYGWGQNTVGELGTGDVISRSSPIQIGSTSWSSVATGNVNTVGIASDNITLFTWGSNTNGQLGTNDLISRSQPTLISTIVNTGVPHSWITVSVNYNHTMALRADNTLWAWGRNTNGELGTSDLISRSSPVQLGAESWSSVSTGENWSSAINNSSNLYLWGDNTNATLGTGDTVHRSSPTQIGTENWSLVKLGATFSAGIKTDNTLWTWGSNTNGQLGISDLISRSSPVQVGASSWETITAGPSYILGKQIGDNLLYGWGSGAGNVLQTIGATSRSAPTQITTSSWAFVSAGTSGVQAINTIGRRYAWGAGTNGYLGIGSARVLPNVSVKYAPTTREQWTTSSRGNSSTIVSVIRDDGALFIWSSVTASGELGQNNTTAATELLTRVGNKSWINVDSNLEMTLAVDTDGYLWGWGLNSSRELGLGNLLNRSSPTQIGTDPTRPSLVNQSWTFISAGTTSYGLVNGTVMVWGRNRGGDWGGFGIPEVRNSELPFSGPIAIRDAGYSFTQVTTTLGFGSGSTMVLSRDGKIFAWGSNANNRLGTDITPGANATVPYAQITPYSTDSVWSSIGFDNSFAYGVKTNGTLWRLSGSSPTLLDSGPWSLIDFNRGNTGVFSIGVKDGILITGLGATRTPLPLTPAGFYELPGNNRSSPTQIGTSSWSTVSAGNQFTFVGDANGALFTWGLNAAVGVINKELTPTGRSVTQASAGINNVGWIRK